MNIRNIRVVQKLRKRSGYIEEMGRFIHKEWTEMVSWKLQKTVDASDGIVWQDVDVVEEWVND